MKYENIEVERHGAVAKVTFNRPERANALNPLHLADIEHAALAFRDDAETRVVVFTGAGRHFSSGADLNERGLSADDLITRRREVRMGERCIQAIREMDQITIAAWRGAAMGGGACLALAMDFRIGAIDCHMSFPEILIGVNLMWQSLPLCVQLMGPARAKRAVISGEWIKGPELERWGVLDEMVESEAVLDKAMEWAALYASRAPVAAQMVKRSANAIASPLDRAIMHMDFDQNLLCAGTADAAEAVRAYRAGETPRFEGR